MISSTECIQRTKELKQEKQRHKSKYIYIYIYIYIYTQILVKMFQKC